MFILTAIFPPIIALLGTTGNICIIIIYSRKRFTNDPLRNHYRLFSFVDILCVLQIIKHFLLDQFNINVQSTSFLCKILAYATYFSSISAWVLAFISIDRMISIVNRPASTFLRKQSSGTVACLIIVVLNLMFYSQTMVYFDVQHYRNNNDTFQTCQVLPAYNQLFGIFIYFDLSISSLIPFFFNDHMFNYTYRFSNDLFKIRLSEMKFYSLNEQRRVRKDIRFSLTILIMDIIFIAFHLPICIYFLLETANLLFFTICDVIYYSAFAVNFFVFFIFNSKFCDEFLALARQNKMAKWVDSLNMN